MYESPIQKIVGEMQSRMIQNEEGHMMMQVSQQVGFHVDKEELLKALQYDRDQYKKGYDDGLKADKWIPIQNQLPEHGQEILLDTKDFGIVVGQYHEIDDKGVFLIHYSIASDRWASVEAIAWQPLPEHYRDEQ